MPIRVVGTPAFGNAANGGNVTLTFSIAPLQNDVVYVAGGHFARAGLGPSTAGYTAVSTDTSTNCNFGLWRKVMGSTPDTTVVCQGGANASDGVAYVAWVLRGVDITTPEDATATKTVATQIGNSPSITTVTDGTMVLSVSGSLIVPTASVNAPTGYGAFIFNSNADTNGFQVLGALKYIPKGGTAEDPGAFTITSGINVSISCAIRPAADDTSYLFRMLNVAASSDGGTAAAHAAASHNSLPQISGATATAWTVSKTAASTFSALQFGTNRAATTFGATTLTGALGTSDSYRSETPLNGTFATGNWIATFMVGANTAITGRGRMRCRFWKSADPTGTSPTDLSGSGGITGTICSQIAATTRSNYSATSLVTWTPGATVTFTNEYLFAQCEWEITTASGSNGDTFYVAGDLGATISAPAFTHATETSLVDTASLTVNSTGWSGVNLRVVFQDGILPTVTTTGGIQLTLKTDSLTSAGQIDSCYIGAGQPDGYGGDLNDFAATPVQVTFGGNNTLALSGAQTIVSDAIPYTHDPTKNLIVHLYFSGTRVDGLDNKTASARGVIKYTKTAANDNDTLDVTGYTAAKNWLPFISQIEMVSVSADKTGTLAVTEGVDAAASTGLAGAYGPFASTEPVDATVAVGTVAWNAALAATEPVDALAAPGLASAYGPFAATEAVDVAASIGSVAWTAALAVTELVDVASAAGTVAWAPVTGTLAVIEVADAASATGSVVWTAALAVNEIVDAATFSGLASATGTFAAIEAVDTASSTGNVGLAPNVGSLAAIETVDAASATGSVAWAGTLAATEDADALASAGLAGRIGSLAATEAADATSSTSLVYWAAALAATEGVDTASVAGLAGRIGALAVTEAADAATATGTVEWRATLAATETADTAALPGLVIASGSLAVVEVADALAAPGLVAFANQITGLLDAIEAADIPAAAGAVTGVVGNLIAAEAADAAAATGSTGWQGSLGVTEASDTAAIFGLAAVTGALLGVEGGDTLGATGTASWWAALAAGEPTDATQATGLAAVLGAVAATEAADAASVLGTVAWLASLAVTESVDTATATGFTPVVGVLAVTETADTFLASEGATVFTGALAIVDPVDVATATGAVRWHAALAATEAADAAAATGVAGVIGALQVAEGADAASVAGSVHWAAVLAVVETGDIFVGPALAAALGIVAASEAPDVSVIVGIAGAIGTVDAIEDDDTAAIETQVAALVQAITHLAANDNTTLHFAVAMQEIVHLKARRDISTLAADDAATVHLKARRDMTIELRGSANG